MSQCSPGPALAARDLPLRCGSGGLDRSQVLECRDDVLGEQAQTALRLVACHPAKEGMGEDRVAIGPFRGVLELLDHLVGGAPRVASDEVVDVTVRVSGNL